MIELLALNQVVSIVGNTKNAGKTTVLNALLGDMNHPCIITSIGLDGEDLDQVTHLEKPKVFVQTNDLVVTADQSLQHFTATYSIIKRYPIASSMGEMVLCKIDKPGKVLLAGPSKVNDMQKVVDDLKSKFNYPIIIDGAFFRQSFAYVGDETILVIGANYARNMETTVENAALNHWRLTLPQVTSEYQTIPNNHMVAIKDGDVIDFGYESILGKSKEILNQTEGIKALFIPKALTDDFVETWTNDFHHNHFDIICQSGVHIQLNDQNLKRLKQLANNIYVLRPIHVGAVCMNPYSPKGYTYPQKAFKQKLSQVLNVDVIDVKEGGLHE